MSEINDRLIEFKEKSGLPGDEIARMCEIPIDSMRKYLQNKMEPKAERAEKILAIIKKALG